MAEGNRERAEGLRLQVYLAKCGVASRRGAEHIITAGRVTVNGRTEATLGSRVFPGDEVRLDGRLLQREETLHHLVLHKPPKVLTTASDPAGRPVVTDYVADIAERLYPAGRLDFMSTGLVLLTNDGAFAEIIVHPSFEIEKEYLIETGEPLPEELLSRFTRGMEIDGVRYRARRCLRRGPRSAAVVLTEGKNREIRRVVEASGLTVVRLHRIRIGTVELGSLREGAYRSLTEEELRWFRDQRKRRTRGDRRASASRH